MTKLRAALAFLVKHSRRLIWAGIIILLVLSGMAGFVFVFGQTDHAVPSDVIVILGAGVHPDGTPTQAQMSRVSHAVALYHKGLAPYIFCTGGFDRPSDVRTEAAACVEMLQLAGIPANAILREDLSTSTEENAIQAGKVMTAHSLKTAILVSDNFHLFRASILFQKYGISVTTSPAQLTAGPIDWKRAAFSSYREVFALIWLAGKTILHLPFTSTPKG